jgi:hypothetical protein
MIKRIATLLASEGADTAGTKIIDIDVNDIISRIVISFKGVNSSSTPTAIHGKMVTKIEILDGSDVLYSLSGIESQALSYYNNGRMPLSYNSFIDNVQCLGLFELDFGRTVWDKQLGLDPRKFRNLQLKITHNKALGGSAPDAGYISAFAYLIPYEQASPVGFLMAKELKSYALTSSAHEYTDLPVDYPYRKIIVQSLAAGKNINSQYNKIKLAADSDRAVILNDLSTSDLAKILQVHPPIVESLHGTGSGADRIFFVTPAYLAYPMGGSFQSDIATINPDQSFGGSWTANIDSAENFQAHVIGWAPHGALDLPFGDQGDIKDWMSVDKFKNLKIDITAGSSILASSTCEIVAQQFRKY